MSLKGKPVHVIEARYSFDKPHFLNCTSYILNEQSGCEKGTKKVWHLSVLQYYTNMYFTKPKRNHFSKPFWEAGFFELRVHIYEKIFKTFGALCAHNTSCGNLWGIFYSALTNHELRRVARKQDMWGDIYGDRMCEVTYWGQDVWGLSVPTDAI